MASVIVGVRVPEPIREATHKNPIWRSRSDFIISATIPGEYDSATTEQLWARKVGSRQFEICCIPFFIYDIALGDVVATTDEYLVERVLRASGRYVFRVWFGDSFHPRDEIAEQLVALGSLVEWSSRNLLAVDAIDARHAQLVADFLSERTRDGELVYEAGRT